jgi:hypothetical protein
MPRPPRRKASNEAGEQSTPPRPLQAQHEARGVIRTLYPIPRRRAEKAKEGGEGRRSKTGLTGARSLRCHYEASSNYLPTCGRASRCARGYCAIGSLWNGTGAARSAQTHRSRPASRGPAEPRRGASLGSALSAS